MTASIPVSNAENRSHTPTQKNTLSLSGAFETVVSLLEQQREAYKQLRGLSVEQGKMVVSGSSEELLAVLAQRQGLIDALAQLNTEISPYREQWSVFWQGLDEAQRERVGGLVSQVEDLLSAIIEQDDRDRNQLQQAQQAVRTEMDRVTQSSAAINAYKVSPGSVKARFTDKNG